MQLEQKNNQLSKRKKELKRNNNNKYEIKIIQSDSIYNFLCLL